ncbi:MAG: hypothetical protein Pg6A_18240 [Termitinemataceae bacterium]|nr:MAG: hypothetical protein Pg6A_18240 [Termitinemataceae bacterium]
MKKVVVLVLLVFWAEMVWGQEFPQKLPAGFVDVVHGNNTVIKAITPKGWICDIEAADSSDGEFHSMFFQDDAYSEQGINMTYYMYIYFEEGNPLSPEEYLQKDLSNYERKGVKPVVRKLDVKLNNVLQFYNYALFEFTGMPNTYKELVLITETKYANVIVVFGNMAGGVDYKNKKNVKKLEKEFKENVVGFYEMIKTISVESPDNIYRQPNGLILYK